MKALAVSAMLLSCNSTVSQQKTKGSEHELKTGAEQTHVYLPMLTGKRVAVLTNHTGLIGNKSLVDTLLSLGVNIVKVFGPEHGFRGDTDAGEKVKSGIDPGTGLKVVSLYGLNKKPTAEQLADIDIVVYDIQDVGVRFYTYISTMSYAMEACAESGKKFMVLDRANPNGFYIDGPVLDSTCMSFLGLHPVPLVYGMTCGEYASMVNGEGWLKNAVKCDLTVIRLKNYNRDSSYSLPVKPSPNLPDQDAILLYPGLGLFEGTIMSLGRGTPFPFKVAGHPDYPEKKFCFTPLPGPVSATPRYVNRLCCGIDLSRSGYLKRHPHRLELKWLMECYVKMKGRVFFEKTFDAHAGNNILKEQIISGLTEAEIRKSWEDGIAAFKTLRSRYLLYADITAE